MEQGKMIAALTGLFSAASIVGFYLGRAESFDYSKPTTAEMYIIAYAKWQRIDTGSSESGAGRLALRAGNRIYSFRTGDGMVTANFLPAAEIAKNPAPKLDLDKDFEKVVGLTVGPAAGTGIAITIADLAKEKNALSKLTQLERLIPTVVTLGAFGAGYYLGHKSEPDYDNVAFRRSLRDVELWRHFEHEFNQLYRRAVDNAVRDRENAALEKLASSIGDAKSGDDLRRIQDEIRKTGDELHRLLESHPEIEAQVSTDPEVKKSRN